MGKQKRLAEYKVNLTYTPVPDNQERLRKAIELLLVQVVKVPGEGGGDNACSRGRQTLKNKSHLIRPLQRKD